MSKNFHKTKNLLNDLKNIKTNIPIYDKKNNLVMILKPIGVICGATPSTNPIATALNYIINSIKCRNSIIICPNPRTYKTSSELIKLVKEEIKKLNFPANLVNIAPKDIIRNDEIINLFNKCDLNIVTGNKTIISRVSKCRKPFLTFGVGNPPIIIEDDANLSFAAKSIIISKSFDNSTSCSADSVLIVNRKIYKNFIKILKNEGLYILNDNEKKLLDDIYFIKGIINPKLIAKSANDILKYLNVRNKYIKKIIGYEFLPSNKDHYILNEKILPLVGITKFEKFGEAIEIASSVLKINGLGHSAGIYTYRKKNILKLGLELKVSRVLVNQPHSKSAGGSKNNSLKTTLSLGCGIWGNNIINDNLHYINFCNLTKLAYEKNL